MFGKKPLARLFAVATLLLLWPLSIAAQTDAGSKNNDEWRTAYPENVLSDDGSGYDKAPQFPGGQEALKQDLKNSLVVPASMEGQHFKGNVIVGFSVLKSGKVTGCYVVEPTNRDLDKAVLKMIKAMPDWIPAREKGKTVRTNCCLAVPVDF